MQLVRNVTKNGKKRGQKWFAECARDFSSMTPYWNQESLPEIDTITQALSVICNDVIVAR